MMAGKKRHALIRSAAAAAGMLVLAALSPLTPTASAATITLELGLDELNEVVRSTLGRVRIRLNNVGPLKGGTYHRKNASSARLPGTLSRQFDIPPAVVRNKRGRRTSYFIADMRSEAVALSFSDTGVRLEAAFELEGPELVARCVRGRGRRARACRAFPYTDINLSQAVVSVDLVPIVHRKSLAFKARSVRLRGDVQISYCDFFLTSWLCTTVVDVPKIVAQTRTRIERKLLAKLNSRRLRDSTARAVLAGIEKRLGANPALPGSRLQVKRLRLADGKLVVTARINLAVAQR